MKRGERTKQAVGLVGGWYGSRQVLRRDTARCSKQTGAMATLVASWGGGEKGKTRMTSLAGRERQEDEASRGTGEAGVAPSAHMRC